MYSTNLALMPNTYCSLLCRTNRDQRVDFWQDLRPSFQCVNSQHLFVFPAFFYEGKGGGSESSAVMGMLECLLSVGKHSMSLVTKVCHWPDSPWLVLFTVSLVLQHPTVSQCGLLCVGMYLQSVQIRLMINQWWLMLQSPCKKKCSEKKMLSFLPQHY